MMSPGEVMLYIFVAGAAATAVWRLAGLIVSSGLDENGAVIAWVRSVSMALVAGLVSRMVLFPPGALADVSISVRVGAFCFGVLCFLLARRHLGIGMLAGVGTLICAQLLGL